MMILKNNKDLINFLEKNINIFKKYFTNKPLICFLIDSDGHSEYLMGIRLFTKNYSKVLEIKGYLNCLEFIHITNNNETKIISQKFINKFWENFTWKEFKDIL